MTAKPDATEVVELLRYCFFRKGESQEPNVMVEGITAHFGFHPGRLAEKRAEIAEQLAGLPGPFHQGRGDGWTFLNACVDDHERQWGEQVTVEALMVLGIAAGLARYCLPRDMWDALPGGVPFFVVLKP